MLNIKSKKRARSFLLAAAAMLAAFTLLLSLLKFVGVDDIGPLGSSVGLASLNGAVRDAVGVSGTWEKVSELLALAAIASALCVAGAGVYQLISRRRLYLVDCEIVFSAGLYILLGAAYLLFELSPVNFRPILVEGGLEASFPSSHTLLALTVLGGVIYLLCSRVKNITLRRCGVALCTAVGVLTVLGRLLSGVHWFTDILGGILLSAALVFMYAAACELSKCK